jgi:hypothetical protein
MKKISLLLLAMLTLWSCTGDRGPVGPRGPQGEPGDFIIGTVFEVEGDFTPQNDYSFGFNFPPEELEVFESDVVLVYLLEEIISDSSGPIDVWTPLPNSFFFDDGNQLVYNFNHTFFDVNIFLDGNVDFRDVPNGFLLDQVFRIAVIPADFAEENPNLNTYESLIDALPEVNLLKIK